MRIQLVDDFRFVHEPRGLDATPGRARVVARDSDAEALASRILLSDGGAFLITGYRGVGKTTFVNEVVGRVRDRLESGRMTGGTAHLLDVYLSLARPMTGVELMHHILRGLHDRLRRDRLLRRLAPGLREDIELAFMRTSTTLAYNKSESAEHSYSLGGLSAKLPFLGLAPSLDLGGKRSRGLSRQMTYLAYDDKAAEQDLIRIGRELTDGYETQAATLRRLARLFNATPRRLPIKVLFVFDELDKLERGGSDAASAVDEMLGSLKTLLTTSGMSFIFVAGKDFHDRWLADVSRGDSIYESVFAHVSYLPALWADIGEFCDPVVHKTEHDSGGSATRRAYGDFKKFLAFKGRGIPRRIFRGFYEHVVWEDGAARLAFDAEDLRRFEFFAGLFDALQAGERELFGERAGERQSERTDQQRLGIYYLTDWILNRGAQWFSKEDALAASSRLSRLVAPAEDVAPSVVEGLTALLIARGYLEPVKDDTVARVVSKEGQTPVWYRVPRRRLIEMGRMSGFFERESEALHDEDAPGVPRERYEILGEIGRGGSSTVFKALDRRTGQLVAIKQLHASLVDSDLAPRFRAEIEFLANLHHPGIVRLHDAGLDAERPYLVMDYLEGVSLRHTIGRDQGLEPDAVLALADHLLDVLAYIHEQGVLWRDAKPSNVLLTPQGRLVIIDFGIAQAMRDELTRTQSVIGTPRYMAPEQIRGERLDTRTDIYAVGTILYELLTGHAPYEATQIVEAMQRVLNETAAPPSSLADVPPALDAVVMKCMEKERDNRFESAAALRAALPAPSSRVDLRDIAERALARKQHADSYEAAATQLVTMAAEAGPAAPPPVAPAPAPPQPTAVAPTIVAPTVLAPDEAAEATMVVGSPASGPRIVMETGAGDRQIVLGGRDASIGRSHDNRIVVRSSGVSRYHAVLRARDAGYVVEDVNSANGLMVNNNLTRGPATLNDGDVLRIGDVNLRYRDDADDKGDDAAENAAAS